jgi:hypothetical protein
MTGILLFAAWAALGVLAWWWLTRPEPAAPPRPAAPEPPREWLRALYDGMR